MRSQLKLLTWSIRLAFFICHICLSVTPQRHFISILPDNMELFGKTSIPQEWGQGLEMKSEMSASFLNPCEPAHDPGPLQTGLFQQASWSLVAFISFVYSWVVLRRVYTPLFLYPVISDGSPPWFCVSAMVTWAAAELCEGSCFVRWFHGPWVNSEEWESWT